MATINYTDPLILTTAVLIGDVGNVAGGPTDALPKPTAVDGINVAAAVEIQSTLGAFLLPRLNTAQFTALNDGPMPLVDGMMLYNSGAGAFELRIGGSWVTFASGNGNVAGPTDSVSGDIAIFGDSSGKLIADSGINISTISALSGSTAPTGIQIGNVGVIQFIDLIGGIFVANAEGEDDLLPIEFIVNSSGGVTQACSLFTGIDPGSSTTVSALVELQSSTGVLLLSRLTNTEVSSLVSPANGMIWYNSQDNIFQGYENGEVVELATGTVGTVTQISTQTYITTTSGEPITSTGTLKLANSTANTILGYDGSGNPTNITAGSNISIISGVISAASSAAVTEIQTSGYISGGPITSTGTLSLGNSTANTLLGYNGSGEASNITAGTNITISGGVISSTASGGSGTVTSIATSGFVSGGTITTTGTITLADSTANTLLGFDSGGVPTNITAGTNITITAGVISSTASGGSGTVTSITTSNGLTGGPITTTGNISIANTGIVAGSYAITTYTANGLASTGLLNAIVTTPSLANQNFFMGYQAGFNAPGAGSAILACIGIGTGALTNMTTGISNVALGVSALGQSTDNNFNTAVGNTALYSLTNASQFNVGFGYMSGVNVMVANQNTYLGYNTTSGSGLTNITALGANSGPTVSNACVLGSAQYVGINNNAPAYSLDIANVNSQCAIQLAASTDTPTTPSSSTSVLFYSKSGTPSLQIGTTGNVYTVASFSSGFAGGTFRLSELVVNSSGVISIANTGDIVEYVNTTSTPYDALTTDCIIGVNVGSAASVVLPAAATGNKGQIYYVKDESGAAVTNHITVSVTGGGNIDGASTNVILTNYGAQQYYSNGTQWFTL